MLNLVSPFFSNSIVLKKTESNIPEDIIGH